MARSSDKKKKNTTPDPASEARFGWADARPYVLGFLAVISFPSVLIAWIVGMPRLTAYAAEATRTASHLRPTEIVFTGEPAKVDGVEQALLEQAYALANANPFDSNTLATIRRAMIDSAWFNPDTLRVSRDLVTDSENGLTFDRITIDGPFRQPYALVRSGNLDYLVDITGTRLPVSYQAGQIDLLIAITGTQTFPPQPGSVWPGSDVSDGLALIRLLYNDGRTSETTKPRPWLDQVKAIDVSNSDGSRRDQPRIVIITERGGRIIWGRPVGQEFGVEIPPHEKLRLLDLEYAERRRIDHAQGDLRINLPVKSVSHEPRA